LLLQAFFMGILAGVCYWIIGLNYAVYIAIWVAISSNDSARRPDQCGVAGAVIALFQWGTIAGLIKVLVIYVVIRTLDDWLLHPMILRRAVHIHPVVTVFRSHRGRFTWPGSGSALRGSRRLHAESSSGSRPAVVPYRIRAAHKSFPPKPLKIPIV